MSQSASGPGTAPARGRLLVVGLVLLGLAAAVTGIAYQRWQTLRCLTFYGPEVARMIASAPRVELLAVAPGDVPGRLVATAIRDVTNAKGLVHLRRGLVEDANFAWERPGEAARLPDRAWDCALVFSDPEVPDARATIVIDLDEQGGALTVLGKPGRVGLGRLGRGLAKWVRGL
ncbi:MAG: hypothetical protein WCR51_13780 [Planctomycetia bacterium]